MDTTPGTEAPLYQHLVRAIEYTLERLGPHGLPLIGRADWNDCLNLNCFSETPGEPFQTTENKEGGVAESVFIAALFTLAVQEMREIAELLAAEFVRQAVAVSSVPDAPVTTTERAEQALIRGDRRRLARVIANLIDNACKHGARTVTLTLSRMAAPSDATFTQPDSAVLAGRWRLSVEDDGPGIDAERRLLVLRPFHRNAQPDSHDQAPAQQPDELKHHEGAGLGLAIVDDLMALYGGELALERSSLGGLAARVWLPSSPLVGAQPTE